MQEPSTPELITNQTQIDRGLGMKVHFLNTKHGKENVEEIWNQCKNADIIFLELVSHKTFKDDLESIVNTAAKSKDPEVKARTFKIIDSINNHVLPYLAKGVVRTGKEIHFIDIDIDSKEGVESSNSVSLLHEAGTLGILCEFDASIAKYAEFIKSTARISAHREDQASSQIQTLINQNKKNWAQKNIVVIQGASHSSVYHKFKKDNIDIPSTRSFPVKDYHFPGANILIRRILFKKPVSEDDYLRAYFSDLVLGAISKESTDPDYNIANDVKTDRTNYKIVKKMSPGKIRVYLQELKEHKVSRTQLASRIIRTEYP